MDTRQKRNFLIITLIGLLYFIVFIFPNAATRGSDNPIVYMHTDEYVTFPIVEQMLNFSTDLSTTWGQLIIYGDYHYGYPFYFLSFLSLLPLRLIQGEVFFNNTAINILILRQMISVLPMILTAGVLVFVATRFKSLWKALFVFLFILTIPAVVRNNTHWWHPDALMMLAIALTFLFLQLDEFRLGKYYYLAAASCGLASAIKLMGFFFFLVIPLYLLFAWRRTNIPLRKVLIHAVLFVFVMVTVIILSNPFLFYKVPREDMLAIQFEKSEELTTGYSHEESMYYGFGPKNWIWTVDVSYGNPNFPILMFLILLIAGIADRKQSTYWLHIAWIVPIGIYLLWFVAPKPDHYLFPLMIPLYSTVISGFNLFEIGWSSRNKWARWAAYSGLILYTIILIAQVIFQITAGVSQYTRYFTVG